MRCKRHDEKKIYIKTRCKHLAIVPISVYAKREEIIDTQQLNKQVKRSRVEYIHLDKIVYAVVAEESEKAKETPLDIIKRLIENESENIAIDKTRYLNTNGGTKKC